jgi:tRNA threonylcarbamoyladenosine biosynthesis protein TsaE
LNQAITFNTNLQKLSTFAEKFALISKPSDIILLQGELGTGKTTFTRFWINALYRKKKIPPPFSIKSPTFPIMISYDLGDYEVYHYDLYRLKNTKELSELNIYENFTNNISIIEWPEILIKSLEKKNYYFIKFSFVNKTTRKIKFYNSIEKIYF